MRPRAPACERNRDPILKVLGKELADCSSVLEIGSGTGEHAVYFAEHLRHLTWQTSDQEENHSGIRAWLNWAELANTRPPLLLDTRDYQALADTNYDAVFSANTSHIMSWPAVLGMFALVGKVLPVGGAFYLYGPFKQEGCFNGDSDRDFDDSLRARDPAMGIRDLEMLDQLAAANGLDRSALYAMPANNWIVVWQKIIN